MAENPTVVDTDVNDVIGVRTISGKQQIYSVLASLQKSRSPITIRFENNDRQYTSLILRTELEEGYIIIDEIAPQDGHQLAMQKQPFSIRGSHGGVSLFFRPNVIAGSGIQSDIAFYKVLFPAEMIYQQRRGAYRAPVARALNIMATLGAPERQQRLTGRLHDLSISGCRINFEGEVMPTLTRGDQFPECHIALETFAIDTAVTVKHATFIRDWKETTCGFQFDGLTKTTQRAIDRFVYFLQREARRLETK